MYFCNRRIKIPKNLPQSSLKSALGILDWEIILALEMPSYWMTHTFCKNTFEYRVSRVAENGLSTLIIRWHFSQHSLRIKAVLFALLHLQYICFPPGLSLSLPLSVLLSAICHHQIKACAHPLFRGWTQQWKTCNFVTCTVWACREAETEHACLMYKLFLSDVMASM